MHLRDVQQSDVPFLHEMLYEAVYWRDNPNKPSYEQAIADPEVNKALADWGKREGDTAVVATVNSVLAGAAWYRYWTDDNFINGYIEETMPVIVIGVRRDYRRQGIGARMMEWLVNRASAQGIQKVSLSVSKDNHALALYRSQGFVEHVDRGDSFLMVRELIP